MTTTPQPKTPVFEVCAITKVYHQGEVEEQRFRIAEIAEVRAKAHLNTVWLRLHKALGGGWQKP
ncbi:MAG: hypothetical protein P8J87_00705 [Verrucomicrobiales bacterium]|nr:hypothetical protein [Verrucomicrobiales bacterium]